MRQHLLAVVLLSLLGGTARADGSWIFQPSTYSHDPQTGTRVTQYQAEPPVYGPADSTYQQSAYIHKRTALWGVDGSVERRHYVETWGAGEAIRPYGEWEYPFRAGATPYGPWGNPSGPWTTPFGSWVNPYGLGRLPTPPWYPWYPPVGDPGGGMYPDAAYPGEAAGANPSPYRDGPEAAGQYPAAGPLPYDRGPIQTAPGQYPGDGAAPRDGGAVDSPNTSHRHSGSPPTTDPAAYGQVPNPSAGRAAASIDPESDG